MININALTGELSWVMSPTTEMAARKSPGRGPRTTVFTLSARCGNTLRFRGGARLGAVPIRGQGREPHLTWPMTRSAVSPACARGAGAVGMGARVPAQPPVRCLRGGTGQRRRACSRFSGMPPGGGEPARFSAARLTVRAARGLLRGSGGQRAGARFAGWRVGAAHGGPAATGAARRAYTVQGRRTGQRHGSSRRRGGWRACLEGRRVGGFFRSSCRCVSRQVETARGRGLSWATARRREADRGARRRRSGAAFSRPWDRIATR